MSSKPQILIIASLPPPYHGCTMAAQGLLDSRLKDEFDILHLDTSDHRDIENLGRFDMVNIFLGLKNLLQLGVVCILKRPDLVYILPGTNIGSCLREGLFVLLASSIGSTHIIAHFHTSCFEEFYLQTRKGFQRFIDLCLKRTARAVVLGDRLRPMVARWFPPDRVEVVPNGTSFDPFPDGYVKKRFDRADPVRLTYMSNIDPAKGIFILIRALGKILGATDSFSLTMAGAWTAGGQAVKTRLDELIQHSSLQKIVHFAGVVEGKEKEELLKNTDIFVLPSLSEAQPKSILEAMSAACPVVSTRLGAIPETVIDGQTGILVERENIDQLATALKTLIENPRLRRQMGTAGRKRYEQYYTEDHHIDQMIRVFQNALCARSP